MRVLMTNIIALCDEGLYEELLRYVPTERQEKIARCGKRQDRMRSLAPGLLLEYGLRSMGCSLLPLVPETETVHLVCGTHGKPELSRRGGGATLTCPMREIMQPRYLMRVKSGSTWNRCGV